MKHFLFLSFICALLCACTGTTAPKDETATSGGEGMVVVKARIFWNHDSLMYYYERAMCTDDAEAQFIAGAAYYLKRQGDMPQEFFVIPQEEADQMLMRSAGHQYKPAIELIECLQEHGCWKHSK